MLKQFPLRFLCFLCSLFCCSFCGQTVFAQASEPIEQAKQIDNQPTESSKKISGNIVVSSMGTDVQYRISRTLVHLKQFSPTSIKQRNSGKLILEVLEQEKAPISLWVNYSHGNDNRLFGHKYYSSGLTICRKDKNLYPKHRSLEDFKSLIDSNKIQFTDDALIVLHACGAASPDRESGLILCQELANITGAKVISGQHKTEPVIEDYKELIYSNTKDFVLFEANQKPMLMGDTIHLTNIINSYIENTAYDFEDYDLTPLDYDYPESKEEMVKAEKKAPNNKEKEEAKKSKEPKSHAKAVEKEEKPKEKAEKVIEEKTEAKPKIKVTPTSQPTSQPTTKPTSKSKSEN